MASGARLRSYAATAPLIGAAVAFFIPIRPCGGRACARTDDRGPPKVVLAETALAALADASTRRKRTAPGRAQAPERQPTVTPPSVVVLAARAPRGAYRDRVAQLALRLILAGNRRPPFRPNSRRRLALMEAAGAVWRSGPSRGAAAGSDVRVAPRQDHLLRRRGAGSAPNGALGFASTGR